MGWIESPPYFCAASETGRDMAQQYIKTPIGSLPTHKFIHHAAQGDDFETLLTADQSDNNSGDTNPLSYVVEVYVDDYISFAIPTSKDQLIHVTNAVMTGIHDIFPADDDGKEDPVSLKKLLKLEVMWSLHKDILGFTFDGVEKTIWLEAGKSDVLLTNLQSVVGMQPKGGCITEPTPEGGLCIHSQYICKYRLSLCIHST